jgi:threonine dehydratase
MPGPVADRLAIGPDDVRGAAALLDGVAVRTPLLEHPVLNERAGGLVVTDEEVRAGIRYALSRLKLALEAGGAVALAALLAGKAPAADGDGWW